MRTRSTKRTMPYPFAYVGHSLAHGAGWKLPLAVTGGLLWTWAQYLINVYEELLVADPLLVVLVITLVAGDFVTGVIASKMDGEDVTSSKLRRGARKVITYVILVGILTMIANAFRGTSVSFLTAALDDAALLYVALTEFVSVMENVTGSRSAAMRVIRSVRSIREGKSGLIIEEVEKKRPTKDDPEEA